MSFYKFSKLKRAQQSIVRDVLHRLGGDESRTKKGAAWIAEKLGRFKPNDSLLTYSALSRVVELETLSAAAQERVALWDTLDAVATRDNRLSGLTFWFFRDHAQSHLEQLSTRRRYAAADAFC
ncbi:MAG: hypothetical protein DWQ34_23910 [Planctomycetota bacterium]|nr:MAG: hypothetical protein DWQ29_17910 [Planctomycetota bacterium]REJ87698.1 MAG: hypothetical protein DWQ34_23910 [Planctomycetota bacterium]REK28160.1 MAG: hypothetical protein DWQ41_06200 [Planctomycetota bacterium]REK34407.1 MAG: hypothetical protein DWQ45_13215 [Planctomycetota bacterium]